MNIKRININQLKNIVRLNAEKDETARTVSKVKVYAVRFLIVVSLLLTTMNVIKGYSLMAITTFGMALGFAFCGWLFDKTDKIKLGNFLVAIMIGGIFSYYALSGQNEGFAILWIMMIPPISANIINLKWGIIVSAYFQVLLVVMFYTKLWMQLPGEYTATFRARFPVLYFAIFVIAYIIAFEKEYYSIQLDNMAHTDALTRLSNRRTFAEKMEEYNKKWDSCENVIVLSFDLNGLKTANDTLGHAAGDELIIGAGECISKAFKGAVIAARVGGDEFSVISELDEIAITKQLNDLSYYTTTWRGNAVDKMTIAVGYAVKKKNPGLSIYELQNIADKEMYEAKKTFYMQTGVDRRRRSTDRKEDK